MPNPTVFTQADFTGSGNTVDPAQLHEELEAADLSSTPVTFTRLQVIDDGGGNFTVYVHLSDIPNGTDRAALGAVAVAHDASGPTGNPNVVEYTDDHTLTNDDHGKQVLMTKATPIVLTVPPGLKCGFFCMPEQNGAGELSFVEGAGVDIKNRQDHLKSAGQDGGLTLVGGVTTLVYKLYGDTA